MSEVEPMYLPHGTRKSVTETDGMEHGNDTASRDWLLVSRDNKNLALEKVSSLHPRTAFRDPSQQTANGEDHQ